MSDAATKFADLLRRLARVPKDEIDKQERKYQEGREDHPAAKPREIVPKKRAVQG